MYCTTNSTPVHRFLLKIVHGTLIQATAVWLLQLRLIIGDYHSALNHIALSVNQVSDNTSLIH